MKCKIKNAQDRERLDREEKKKRLKRQDMLSNISLAISFLAIAVQIYFHFIR